MIRKELINIKKILSLFYNFIIDELFFPEESTSNCFLYRNNLYCLSKVNINCDFNYCIFDDSCKVLNVFNTYFSFYYEDYYILYKKKNYDLNISSDYVLLKNLNSISFDKKWDYYSYLLKSFYLIKKYIDNKNGVDYISSYFLNLYFNVLCYSKKIDKNKLRYGLVKKQNISFDKKCSLQFACNYCFKPIVLSFSEYIKYNYFVKNKFVFIDFFNSNYLSQCDYMLFYCNLLLPSYYFDLMGKECFYVDRVKIINNLYDYYKYVKFIYKYIKKRYCEIPSIDY